MNVHSTHSLYAKNAARASELLDGLAWSVRHQMPLATALRSFFRLRGVSRVFRYVAAPIGWFFRLPALLWLVPILWLIWSVGLETGTDIEVVVGGILILIPLAFLVPVSRIAWNWRINNLVLDLGRGMSLHDAMKRNVGYYLPGYVLSAIQAAESHGTLDTALPHLASQLQRTREIHQRRGVPVAAVFGKTLFCLTVFLFVVNFTFPRLWEIAMNAGSLDNDVRYLGPFAEFLSRWGGWILWSSLFLFALVSVFPWLRRRVAMWIPFVRRDCRRVFLCDAACSMAHHMRQGETMVTAADHTLAGCRMNWQRKGFQAFRDEVADGEPWNEAWNRMALGGPLDAWFADVAASREDPVEGFENMVAWAEHDIGRHTALLLRWLDPAVSLLLGLAILWMARVLLFGPVLELISSIQEAIS